MHAAPLVSDVLAVNRQTAAWCAEVNAAAQRLGQEPELLDGLPSLRPEIGARPPAATVGKLPCVRFWSARYSVLARLGYRHTALLRVTGGQVQVLEPFSGEIVAGHALPSLRDTITAPGPDRYVGEDKSPGRVAKS